MRIGILGGSFDPVHYGHLLLAECCREDCQLDQVWFVPAAISPHKLHKEPTSAKARIEMLELAIAGHTALHVSTLETDRGGVSYTFETLEVIADQHPGDELFFLMGADSLRDLPRWRRPDRICELARPVVVRRHGSPDPEWRQFGELLSEARLAEAQREQVQMPRIELCSSEIRKRLSSGKSIRYWTPRAVEKYIETHGLYR